MKKKLSMLLGILLVFTILTGLTGYISTSAASKVKLSSKKKTLYVGETFNLTLKNAKGKVKWSSTDKSVATVKGGTVTAVSKGTATIKAKDTATKKTYKCKITVKKKQKTEPVTDPTPTPEPVKDSEPVELTLWMLGVDGDALDYAYSQAIEDLKITFPDVNVKVVSFDNETYKDVIKTAVKKGTLPDIFFTWSCSFLGDFVEQGKVYCLDKTYKKYLSNGDVTEAMLRNTTYNGKHYGVPLTMNVACMYSNMDILKAVGYKKVPTTYDELIKCCEKLVEEGYTPFAMAGAEAWCIAEYLEPLMQSKVGAATLSNMFDGNASFENQGIVSAANEFSSMVEKGYFNSNMMETNSMEAQELFYNGESAFLINGSWLCGVIQGDPELLAQTKVSAIPYATTGEFIGGPSDSLAVSASSSNAELAAKYALELGKLVSKYSYLDGAGLPAWKIDYDDSNINSLTRTVASMCAKASSYTLFGDTEIKAKYVDAYLESLTNLLAGKETGEEFASNLAQEIK
jgi:raffinose/stachyose/melibiose transport system substrate-binding protein